MVCVRIEGTLREYFFYYYYYCVSFSISIVTNTDTDTDTDTIVVVTGDNEILYCDTNSPTYHSLKVLYLSVQLLCNI